MTNITLIKNADWIVAWDAERSNHVYVRDGDVAFTGNELSFVGQGYAGAADTTVDGAGLLVLPGTLSLHAHAYLELHGKGFYEDLASKHLWMSRLYEYTFTLPHDDESALAAMEVGMCELLKSGCTTFAELYVPMPPIPNWLDALATSGIRAYACPMVQSAEWYSPNGTDVLYRWYDRDDVERNFAAALDLIDAAECHPSGRLKGMIGASQVDTCSAELLQRSLAAAKERGIPMQVHTSQSVVEFREIVRRHNKTPVQFLEELGILGPHTILGHCLNIDSHPWINFHTQHGPDSDLARLARSNVSVVHCPRQFAQLGDMMRSLGGYLKAGSNVCFGTDSYPLDMIEEMRIAGLLSKVASGHVDLLKTQDIFRAATVNAAQALGRDDLGRLAPGAKADIVLVNLKHPTMRPLRDPLKNLIYTGRADAVRDVFVDGVLVVRDGEVLTIDHDGALDRIQAGQERALARVGDADWAHRTADEISPLSLPLVGD